MPKPALPRHLRYEMRLTLRFRESWERRYWVEGRDGALEFWVRESPRPDDGPEFYGGVEQHSVTPTSDTPPDHARCPQCSGRPCWHDGSSTAASEDYIPFWLHSQGDHESVFRRLASDYDRRFAKDEGEQEAARG